MDEKNELPVRIDLDVSAKAELKAEIKAEVPTSSVGRLVDALTDAIRPFTEVRGLRADELRLQREDVLIKIARKAQERMAIEAILPQAIPNKVLVQLLERASLEDPADEFMTDKWAELLASASVDADIPPRIVSILGELRSRDAHLLEQIARGNTLKNNARNAAVDARVSILREEFDGLDQSFDPRMARDDIEEIMKWENSMDHLFAYVEITFAKRGMRLAEFLFSSDEKRYSQNSYPKLPTYEDAVSAQILVSLGLLSEHRISYPVGEYFIDGAYHQLTTLGVKFLSICSSDIRRELVEIEQRRQAKHRGKK